VQNKMETWEFLDILKGLGIGLLIGGVLFYFFC